MPPRDEALRGQIAALGKSLSTEQFKQAYERIDILYELKNAVYLSEIEAIVEEILLWPASGWKLVSVNTTVGSNVVPAATILLKNPAGKDVVAESIGDSSTDAICSAIEQATNTHVFLRDLTYKAISSGANGMGKATLTVEHHNGQVTATACSVDIIEAVAKAYLIAVSLIAEKAGQQY